MPLHKITISKWLVDLMRREYGDNDVSLVLNSVDHQQFFAAPRGKQERPTIGFLYHEAPFKGVDVALEVLSLLKEKFPTLRVITFGSFPRSGNFNLPENCEFHLAPDQHRIRDLYAQCDVWLAPSRSEEGFNLTAMEAMACRVPLVSTRTAWPAEAINSYENGVLTEIDDSAALAAGVEHILSLDDSGWRAISEKAYQTVASSSWEKSAKAFETVLGDVCEQRTPA
jgi:glycosyltransferase involved in cell wall biosynthesis